MHATLWSRATLAPLLVTSLAACAGHAGAAPDARSDAPSDAVALPDARSDAPFDASASFDAPADASALDGRPTTDASPLDASAPDPCLGHTCGCSGGVRGDLLGLQQQFPSDVAAFDALIGRLHGYGVRWVRMYWMWPWVEATAGVRNFAPVLAAVTAAHARGMKILVLATGAPPWANGGMAQDFPPTDAHVADYAAYAAAMASGPAPDAIELWNEPNNAGFWQGGLDAARVARMQAAAYRAIKAARPGTIVVTGGLTQVDAHPQDFFAQELAADPDFYRSFDAVGLHPYNEPVDPLEPGGYPNILTVQLPAIRAMLTARGRGDAPFWMTEYGVATSGEYSVSEANQAVYAQHLFDGLARLRGEGVSIGPAFLYMLQDWSAYGSSSSEQPFFGLERSDGSAKPAAATVRAFAAMPCD